MEDLIAYYRSLGAPQDQSAVIALLKELQQENGGSLPKPVLSQAAAALGTKEALLLALVRRIPSLRLSDGHVLQMCAGPNCGKSAHLAALAETLCAGTAVTLQFTPCMRMCGKGPNLKFDGQLYHKADEVLLRSLLEK